MANISQILLFYKVLGRYNKFDFMKSLGIYYRYVKMPLCGYKEHGLEYFSFYVQKHIAHLAACSGTPAGSRRAARGARISRTRLLGLLSIRLWVQLSSGTRWKHSSHIHFIVLESAWPGLTHWGQDKMDAILQTTLSNRFSWMKML